MSFDALRWALQQPTATGTGEGMTSSEKFVLVVLANRSRSADGRLVSWPSLATIANETGRSRKTVQRALKGLGQKGLLKRSPRKQGKKRSTDLFIIDLKKGVPLDAATSLSRSNKRAGDDPEGALRVDSVSAPSGRGGPPPGPKMTPRISKLESRTETKTSGAVWAKRSSNANAGRERDREVVRAAYLKARTEWVAGTRGRNRRPPNLKTRDVDRLIDNAVGAYDVETVCAAVRGIFLCPHNLGQNDRGQCYLDIRIALRLNANSDNVYRFAQLWEAKSAAACGGSRSRQERRGVLERIKSGSVDPVSARAGLNGDKGDLEPRHA